jgi:hypothetical protein
VIDVTGTIPLKSGLPTLTPPMTIQGPGPNGLRLYGSAVPGRTLAVSPDQCSPSSSCQVTLRGVSINHSPLGIWNRGGGVLYFIDSRLSDNATGIYAGPAAETTRVIRSTVRDSSTGTGTAILGDRTSVRVSQSTLIDNPYGVSTLGAVAVVNRSTLSGGVSGVYQFGGEVRVIQSTLSDYDTAISNHSSPTRLRSTIAANSSVACGSAQVISEGFNLADDGSCNLFAPGDKQNTEPLLRPQAAHSGPCEAPRKAKW